MMWSEPQYVRARACAWSAGAMRRAETKAPSTQWKQDKRAAPQKERARLLFSGGGPDRLAASWWGWSCVLADEVEKRQVVSALCGQIACFQLLLDLEKPGLGLERISFFKAQDLIVEERLFGFCV